MVETVKWLLTLPSETVVVRARTNLDDRWVMEVLVLTQRILWARYEAKAPFATNRHALCLKTMVYSNTCKSQGLAEILKGWQHNGWLEQKRVVVSTRSCPDPSVDHSERIMTMTHWGMMYALINERAQQIRNDDGNVCYGILSYVGRELDNAISEVNKSVLSHA